jgi:hypothetical protein
MYIHTCLAQSLEQQAGLWLPFPKNTSGTHAALSQVCQSFTPAIARPLHGFFQVTDHRLVASNNRTVLPFDSEASSSISTATCRHI